MRALRVFTGFESTRLALISYADDSAEGISFDGSPYSKDAALSIGTPGEADFGTPINLTNGLKAYVDIIHTPSGSVISGIPSSDTILFPDPYADPTASGFTADGDPFPIPDDGYTIGNAGAEHFGIATNLDDSAPIIDPIHTASLSVM
jgi:hypothetical protein